MILINGIQDMKRVIEKSLEEGKWQSWFDNYYMKYKKLFNYQLETLYMADINLFKELVEKIDFEEIQVKIDSIEKDININETYIFGEVI